MFDNIGKKMKGLAQCVCWLGIIVSVIAGFVVLGIGSSTENGGGIVVIGILIAVAGSFLSWIGSFLLYGFGQLVENSDILAKQGNTPTGSKPLGSISTQQGDCKESVGFIYVGETNIKCANCGCVQFKGNKKCTRCGSIFSN